MTQKIKLAAALALTAALISGTNNFLTKIAVTSVSDPVVYTFIKNGLVAVFLIGLILFWRRGWKEIKELRRRDIIYLLLIGAIGGSLPFILYFTGLKTISVTSAAFIHKTLFLWVALLAIPLLKERIGLVQTGALALLMGGGLFMAGQPFLTGSRGELMILAATILWAVENIIAKKTLARLSSLTVAGARMVIGSLIISAIIVYQEKTFLIFNLNQIQWSWTILTSVLLAGYVLTWYTALKHAPATFVASLLVPATYVTNILTSIFITHAINPADLASGFLLTLGISLLIYPLVVIRRLDRRIQDSRVNGLPDQG